MDRKKKIWYAIVTAVLWIAVWQTAAFFIDSKIFLPSPLDTARSLGVLLVSPEFYHSVAFSLGNIAKGFLLGVFLGTALAVAASCSAFLAVFLSLPMRVIKAVPVASFTILALFWVDSTGLSVLISFFMVLPIIYTNVLTGIRETDEKLLEMADVFSIRIFYRVRFIYAPAVLPYLFSAASVAIGLAWKSGIAAEVIGRTKASIGNHLNEAKIYLEMPMLFAWTVVIVAISILSEELVLMLLRLLEKKALGKTADAGEAAEESKTADTGKVAEETKAVNTGKEANGSETADTAAVLDVSEAVDVAAVTDVGEAADADGAAEEGKTADTGKKAKGRMAGAGKTVEVHVVQAAEKMPEEDKTAQHIPETEARTISLKNISKAYGGNRVLDNVSFGISPKQPVALMGSSGIGKTTLLRIALGTEKPDGGAVEKGRGVTTFSVVFQENRLCEGISVEKNLQMICKNKMQREEITVLLRRLGLEHCKKQRVALLSGGMKRRVAIGRALLYDAPVFLLDEPFQGLDEKTKQRVIGLVREKMAGKSVLLITHEKQECQDLNCKIIHL